MIKKYWDKILLILSAAAGIAFALSRIFAAKNVPADEQKLAEHLMDEKRGELEQEKKQLEKEEKAVQKREYTDEEIEKKYNK